MFEKMNRFERMIATQEEEYNHLCNVQHVHNRMQNHFYSLSIECSMQGYILDPYTGINRQEETGYHDKTEVRVSERSAKVISIDNKNFVQFFKR